MRRKSFALAALCLMLAACGKYGDLEPQQGKSLPPAPYGQVKQPEASELLTPDAQQQPGRSDELLQRSERRGDDPFDLPPGSDPATIPINEDEDDAVDASADIPEQR